MNRLPNHGRCLAAFLLAYSTRVAPASDQLAWEKNTTTRSTIMAKASDLTGTASLLVEAHLAKIGANVELDERLYRVSYQADRNSLLTIARLIMECYPPDWIKTAVINGRLFVELIPEDDLHQLNWIGDDLEPLILDVREKFSGTSAEDLRKKIGHAGELAIMSALSKEGFAPKHVALISDAYGYDICYESEGRQHKIEVKSCMPSTQERFFLSRNEFNKACDYPESWRLIQVTFSSSVILNSAACSDDILKIRELPASEVVSIAPEDTGEFQWLESAKFEPHSDCWHHSDLQVEDGYNVEFKSFA